MSELSVVWAVSTDRDLAGRLLADDILTRYRRAVVIDRLCPRCGSGGHGRPVARWVPALAGTDPPAVSLSRGGGLTIVAVADTVGLGVDVEPVAPFADRALAEVLLHEQERAPGAEELATTWVRTEAALKAAGTGLAVDPATVRLAAADRPPTVLQWPAGVARPGWLLDLDLGPAALAVRAAVAGTGPTPRHVSVRQVAGPAAARG